MTNPNDRAALRALQDRWLDDPLVARHIARHGEEVPIATGHGPTFRDVRTKLLPGWAAWFQECMCEN